jgi:hypothetical protein
LLFGGLVGARAASAQIAAPEHDVLLFKDGEKLIGQLKSATATSLVFKSDMAGDITVDWTKVQELHSSRKFAAVPKDVIIRGKTAADKVPQGAVAMVDQKLEIAASPTAPAHTMPPSDLASLVDEASFQRALQETSLMHGWKGGVTAGAAFTEATQKSETFTAALNMVRSVPDQSWLDLRSRSIFNLDEAYGKLSQPGTPTVKTSLYHIDAEQDYYFSRRLFLFGGAAFDHNFSQGLKLQQAYGGGLGFVAMKSDKEELDAKVSGDYIRQSFEAQPPAVATASNSLFGTVFAETYIRHLAHGILFNEQGTFTPAWNETKDYSAFANAGLTLPVFHRFGVTLGAQDDFLNDPPPGLKKNSFQATLGATYSFK